MNGAKGLRWKLSEAAIVGTSRKEKSETNVKQTGHSGPPPKCRSGRGEGGDGGEVAKGRTQGAQHEGRSGIEAAKQRNRAGGGQVHSQKERGL